MNLYFMLNINLHDFDIIGIRQSENKDILISISCKNCGYTKEVRLKENRINIIRCNKCSRRNYVVYKVEEDTIVDAIVLNRSEYLKYYNNSVNKTPEELYKRLMDYLENGEE